MSGAGSYDVRELRSDVQALVRWGSEHQLRDLLDCDTYTAAGDLRTLEGLGWTPCELRPAERSAIRQRLSELWPAPS